MTKLSPEDQQALDCLRRAVTKALERKRRLGHYAVIWRDGRVVKIMPEDYTSAKEPQHPDRG